MRTVVDRVAILDVCKKEITVRTLLPRVARVSRCVFMIDRCFAILAAGKVKR